MAVADVYDALISRRCYKAPFGHEDACAFIQQQNGVKFDPTIVAAFEQLKDQFAAIANRYRDCDTSRYDQV